MISNHFGDGAHSPRVLLFSERNIHEHEVWRCAFHEFEELLQSIESVDLVAPYPRAWYKNGKRVALRLGRHFTSPINPGIAAPALTKEYDLFFAVCEKPSELLNVNALHSWRDHCRTSFCLITEFYAHEIPISQSCMEVLSRFDHVLFMFNTNQPFQKLIGGKGTYFPAGIDAIQFCPYPSPPPRFIDVLSIGRRSEETHQALLKLVRDENLFYIYDTINDLHAYNLEQHRQLVANMARRTKYFIVNPGKINLPQETGGQSEFGYRYFEGAAPGTVMIGETPKNEEFSKIFHWEDAVVHLPFGSDQIGTVIRELDEHPERQARIRRTNIVESLLHHDWVYRWEAVLRMADLSPLPQLQARKERLRELTAMVQEEMD